MKVRAGDVEGLTRDWSEFAVLIPDALTDPGPPPQFGPVWVGVEATALSHFGSEVTFILDGGIRWAVSVDREVELSESTEVVGE